MKIKFMNTPPGTTRKLAHTDGAIILIDCIAIEAVGGSATFTTLKEAGITSPLQGATLARGETWYSYNERFTQIELASGTVNYYLKHNIEIYEENR